MLAALDAPLEQGTQATVRYLVRELSSIAPDLAVGICLQVRTAEHAPAIPWIDAAHPLSVREPSIEGPLRLFSLLERETVLELEPRGSTLHLAHRGPPGALPTGLGFPSPEQELDFTELAVRVVRRCLALSQHGDQLATERERLRARLMQADRLAALGQITTGILHDLNNPLTSILTYADWLRRRAQERNARGEATEDELVKLERIMESAERIAHLSEDLLKRARPGSDAAARVSLLEVIEKALSFCEHELERHRVVLERQLEVATPFVRGVASQLVQVLVNLVTNAIHAASEGGREILVQAHSDGEWGVICIADNGPGIAPEHLDRIFDPFVTTKPEGQGTGLGLAIVKDLVSRHGGLISVESTPGRGATFIVQLPVA